jgi:hypothetical protein
VSSKLASKRHCGHSQAIRTQVLSSASRKEDLEDVLNLHAADWTITGLLQYTFTTVDTRSRVPREGEQPKCHRSVSTPVLVVVIVVAVAVRCGTTNIPAWQQERIDFIAQTNATFTLVMVRMFVDLLDQQLQVIGRCTALLKLIQTSDSH